MKEINKSEVLETIIENCTRKTIDIEIEIKVLERQKILHSGSEEKLLFLQRQIDGDKDLMEFYKAKIEAAKYELNGESARRTNASGSFKKGKEG
jgi:hypothetical protein